MKWKHLNKRLIPEEVKKYLQTVERIPGEYETWLNNIEVLITIGLINLSYSTTPFKKSMKNTLNDEISAIFYYSSEKKHFEVLIRLEMVFDIIIEI